MPNQKIEIYTDGSCIGNPGPGGWAAIIFADDDKHEISGPDPDTTNNRMEMMAMIKALNWLHEKYPDGAAQKLQITVFSDSNLLVQSLNLGWKRKANLDLWAEMDAARAWLNIKWQWVKAHAKNKYNNEVDVLAFNEAKKLT